MIDLLKRINQIRNTSADIIMLVTATIKSDANSSIRGKLVKTIQKKSAEERIVKIGTQSLVNIIVGACLWRARPVHRALCVTNE